MILGTTRAVRAFAYPQPADLRKGYNGLFGLVKTGLGRDPLIRGASPASTCMMAHGTRAREDGGKLTC